MEHKIKISIDRLKLDFQPEENLIDETVQYLCRLSDARRYGLIEAVTVYSDGLNFWLYDGFHRTKAHRIVGLIEIEAEIVQGTYADMESQWRAFLRELKGDISSESR